MQRNLCWRLAVQTKESLMEVRSDKARSDTGVQLLLHLMEARSDTDVQLFLLLLWRVGAVLTCSCCFL